MKTFLKILKIIGISLGSLIGAIVLFLLVLFGYWYLRPNQAHVNKTVVVDSWDIANDKNHNSNTDMIQWKGQFYLAYVSSPFHFASNKSVLHIKVSNDQGHTWNEVQTFNANGQDIRDPKFAIIGNRLFLYALKNDTFLAEPYLTMYSYTDDGTSWQELQKVANVDGWLFWRPKTQDGITYYDAAYWHEHGKSVLLKSTDGINWEIVSYIHQGQHNDETEIEFLPDGRLLATARLEYDSFGDGMFGSPNGATLITVSEPPFTTWTDLLQSKVTRLDGPNLFTYDGRVFAVGRYQVNLGHSGPLTDQGSALAKKRTSLFEVRQDGLAYLTDLPSDGDTSYEGLIIVGDKAYISYYTSPINHDFAWILGMLSPSQVRMAVVDLKAMETLANQTPAH
ncbi:MAG TPA: sialidase family protein [Anaerolineales bacterium]|nr:sialidase family protein [Anaerolineales bacterium]